MPDPIPGVIPAASAPAAVPTTTPVASPAQAKPVQATPAAPAGVPSKPGDVKPEPGMVPLPALQEERSKRQQLESEVAELRRMVTQTQYSQQQQQPMQPTVDPRKELEQLWESDPKKAVQVEIMYAMDWRDRVDASLDVQADQLSQKYPDFSNYRSMTLNYVRSLPLNQRGAQGILEAAYFMTRGQNVDQLLQQREATLLEKYRNGEITAAQLQSPAGSYSAPAPTGVVTLTPEQHAVAEMMGMTDAQYAANMKTHPGGR